MAKEVEFWVRFCGVRRLRSSAFVRSRDDYSFLAQLDIPCHCRQPTSELFFWTTLANGPQTDGMDGHLQPPPTSRTRGHVRVTSEDRRRSRSLPVVRLLGLIAF
jgi:hypothetical protein